MRRATALVETWLAQGRRAVIARPIGTVGLGPRSDDDLLLVDPDGRAAGTLLAGTAETAVSIVAEIRAVRSGRTALALRDTSGRISP